MFFKIIVLPIIFLGVIVYTFYRQAKTLGVDRIKWIVLGGASILLFMIPIWMLLVGLIDLIFFPENNNLARFVRVATFVIISIFVRKFLFNKLEKESIEKMEKEKKKIERDEKVLDDLEF